MGRQDMLAARAYRAQGRKWRWKDRAETVDREQEALILDGIERFLDRDVRPHVAALEHDDIYPEDIVEKMKEMGLFGATISEEYGGLGLPITTYAKIIERLSHAWMSVSGLINSHLIMAAAVERFGTDDQRHVLPAPLRQRRAPGRARAHRAGLRHRPAGDSHHGAGATAITPM